MPSRLNYRYLVPGTRNLCCTFNVIPGARYLVLVPQCLCRLHITKHDNAYRYWYQVPGTTSRSSQWHYRYRYISGQTWYWFVKTEIFRQVVESCGENSISANIQRHCLKRLTVSLYNCHECWRANPVFIFWLAIQHHTSFVAFPHIMHEDGVQQSWCLFHWLITCDWWRCVPIYQW